MSQDAAFDIQLLQKILPRIQGSSLSVKRALLQLLQESGRPEDSEFMTIMDDATPLYSGNH